MHYFPVSSSTLSAAHLGAFLYDQYGLGPNTHCKLLRAAVNHSYLVMDGNDKYVFRIYSLHWRTEKEIGEEIRLLQLLQANGIPVSYALPATNGNYLSTLLAPEGPRYGVLFSYAKGEKVLGYSAEMHFKVGEIMARMHRVTQDVTLDRVTYTPDILLIDSFDKIKPYISMQTEEMQFMRRAQHYLLGAMKGIDRVRRGAVHLDIWFDNLNIYNNEEVTIFDFDFCGNGWLALDLAYYQMQVFNVEKEPGDYDRKWNAFVEGYGGIAEEELQILPVLSVGLYFFYLGVQCQRFENWTSTFLNETYLKRYINLVVKKIYQFHKLPDVEI